MFLRIRQERKAKGWTQAYAAQQLGLTKAAYGNIETGQRKPSYDVLLKLLDVFGYSDPRLLFEAATPGATTWYADDAPQAAFEATHDKPKADLR